MESDLSGILPFSAYEGLKPMPSSNISFGKKSWNFFLEIFWGPVSKSRSNYVTHALIMSSWKIEK